MLGIRILQKLDAACETSLKDTLRYWPIEAGKKTKQRLVLPSFAFLTAIEISNNMAYHPGAHLG